MRALGGRVAAVWIGVVGALVVAELAVRLFLPPPERAVVGSSGHIDRLDAENAKPAEVRARGSVEDESTGGLLYIHTPTGMRFRANTRAVIENHRLGGRTVEIRTNSFGHRGPEPGPKDRTRVLFVGDSITAQDYLPEEETIVRLVQDLSEATDRPLQTINAGVGAIGTANELAILMETGFATDPDVVVLNWYLNDVQASSGVEIVAAPSGWLSYSRLAELLAASFAALRPVRQDVSTISPETAAEWRREVAARLPARPGDLVRDPMAFNQRILDLQFDWGSAWSIGAWQRMAPIVVEMKRQCDLHGVRFLIVAFPVTDQLIADYVYDEPQRRLAAIAAELDVPMLDLLPMLRKEIRQAEVPLYLDWCHPSATGSARIAEAILRFVQREG